MMTMMPLLYVTLVSAVAATGCMSGVQQFTAQCASLGSASACEAQIACEWWSCYGNDSSFDSQCGQLTDEATCAKQVACSWGRPLEPHCFAATKDSGLMLACMAASTEDACQKVIGCDWRLVDDADQWLDNMRSVENQYACSCPDLRPQIMLSPPDFTGSAYNFAATPVTDLPSVTNAWVVKYNLPLEVAQVLALPDQESGNYTESGKWSSLALAYNAGSGRVTYAWLVSAGRQWNGIDSKAFVFMNATAVITAPLPLTPSDLEAIKINITLATQERMRSTELVLLQQAMRSGTDNGGAKVVLDMTV